MFKKRDFWERVGSSIIAGLVVASVVAIATFAYTKLSQTQPVRAVLSSVVVPNPFYPNRQYLGSQVGSLLESQFGYKNSTPAWWDFANEANLQVGTILIKNLSDSRSAAVEVKSPTAVLFSQAAPSTEPVSRVVIPAIDPNDSVMVSYVGRPLAHISMVYDGRAMEYATATYPNVFGTRSWFEVLWQPALAFLVAGLGALFANSAIQAQRKIREYTIERDRVMARLAAVKAKHEE